TYHFIRWYRAPAGPAMDGSAAPAHEHPASTPVKGAWELDYHDAPLKTWPSSCGLAGWQALPSIQTLLKAAREAGIPIVHMTGLDQDGVPGWAVRRGASQPAEMSPAARDRWQRRYDIVDEVAPVPGEAVLRKS